MDNETKRVLFKRTNPNNPNRGTLCIIKPHALAKGSAGDIIQDIVDSRYEVKDLALFHLDISQAEEFLEIYKGVLPEHHVGEIYDFNIRI
jgi:hypothetical protein